MRCIRTGLVVLDDWDLYFARSRARERHLECIRRGYRDRHGLPQRSRGETGEHVCGCLCELAFARKQRVRWPAHVNTFKDLPDVGDYEVRGGFTARSRLIIRPGDDPARPYVCCVTVRPPRYFWVVGWLWGHEVREEWKAAPNGRHWAWFVPHPPQRQYTPVDFAQVREAAVEWCD